mmetsp:Transcript_6121/g.12621  ORF Transcript_6121/g.12621 Transcript_6121/m.12621 type:complete len:96 (+) Transcript_6121:391-678(+)
MPGRSPASLNLVQNPSDPTQGDWSKRRPVVDVKVGICQPNHRQTQKGHGRYGFLPVRNIVDNGGERSDGQDEKESQGVTQLVDELQLTGTEIEDS